MDAVGAAPARKTGAAKANANANGRSGNGGGGQRLDMQRSRTALPQSQALRPKEVQPRALGVVKPPRSSEFLESGSKEAQYEKLVDEEIKALYKLSAQNRRSPSRGEIWLRLGERYVEKARLVEFRAQAEYDKKLKDYAEKKTRIKPRIDMTVQREYNQKAVQLYEWFVKDFPKDSKVDQAMFFLGYNHFELGNTKVGEEYYINLVKNFPESPYVTESHFALGEFYFENENWQPALDNYIKVIKVKKARLNAFALYKASWCLYRLNRVGQGLKLLERVVRLSRAADASDNITGRKAVNKVRLANEALKDYVPFYAETGDAKGAVKEFARVSQDEAQTFKMLERLAYLYSDTGNRANANFIFKQLISMNPGGEKSAEYQYQVVLTYATSDQKEFRKELEIWLESFGPNSYWAKENAKNPKVVADMTKLQEATLRNHVLQLHQTAQNSRAPYSQQAANAAYNLYLKYFSDSPQIVEMQFFHAELLFDMQKHAEAANLYMFVADKDSSGQFRDKAIINAVLALEKDLPNARTIDEKRGNSLERIPLDPPVARFEKAALRYIQAMPRGEKTPDIQRRLGVLYYSYNHFDEAIDLFQRIIKDNPKSPNAEIAGNLILDIFKLKGDMAGFTEKGQELLANPAIANSKFGVQVKVMLEKATYMKADKMAEGGDSLKAAKEFETFAGTYKASELTSAARFKAAVNYEKGGDLVSASRMYVLVLQTPQQGDNKLKTLQNDSRNALARIYQQTGQLELAAKQYQQYAAANTKDSKAVNAFYNAGILWESLGEWGPALDNYNNYFNLSKKGDRVEVLFNQAEILRKKGSISKASAMYDQYLNSGPRSEGNAIQSAFHIAEIAQKQGLRSKAKQWYEKTVAMHRRSGKQGREAGVKYAAESRFQLAQETLDQLMAVRFGTSDKNQARAAVEVKRLREKYIGEMKEVIRYDNGPFIVAALASGGQMFDSLAQVFLRIPVPAGFSGEDAKKYKDLIQVQINGFRTEAKNSYKAAVEKSIELEAFTSWTRIALAGLHEHDPENSADVGEVAADARAADWMGL